MAQHRKEHGYTESITARHQTNETGFFEERSNFSTEHALIDYAGMLVKVGKLYQSHITDALATKIICDITDLIPCVVQ